MASPKNHGASSARDASPLPGNYSAYREVAQLGYMMTAPDPAKPSVELEECISKWPGPPDRILMQRGLAVEQKRSRTRRAGARRALGPGLEAHAWRPVCSPKKNRDPPSNLISQGHPETDSSSIEEERAAKMAGD